jgi:hypothetical protein
MDFARTGRNIAFMYSFLWIYPTATPPFNRVMKENFGNDTEVQLPETVDDAVLQVAWTTFTKTSWTFQGATLLVCCGNLLQLLRLILDVIYFFAFVLPRIVEFMDQLVRLLTRFVQAFRRPIVVVRAAPRRSARNVRR